MSHPLIEELVAKIDKQRAEVLSWNPLVEIAEQVKSQFLPAFKGRYDWQDGVEISLGIGSGCLNGVLVHLQGVKDIRDTIPVRAFLRKQGFPVPTVSDYEEIGRRSWTYKTQNGPFVLSAFMWRDGDAITDGVNCRFVKIGEEKTKGSALLIESLFSSHCPRPLR